MAQIIYIRTSSNNGSAVLSALADIRRGIGKLQELDGFRAESIGAGQDAMAQNFGTAGEDEAAENAAAQALSDRWGFFLAKWINGADTDFSSLRDFVNATAPAP